MTFTFNYKKANNYVIRRLVPIALTRYYVPCTINIILKKYACASRRQA